MMKEPPLIIPIFLPFAGCRSRCLFCNQKAAPDEALSPFAVRPFIEASLRTLPSHRSHREKQVAFYGGSFTAMEKEDQISYLREVQPFLSSGLIESVRISTRPDGLDEETLARLMAFRVKTVEIGVQSMVDEVLLRSQRGHRAEETRMATAHLKQEGFEVGHQLMIGLPGDTFARFQDTLDRIIDLEPDFVRIHPTLVLRGSPLETLWRDGIYAPLSLEETVQWLKSGLLKLEGSSIRIARLGLQPTRDLERDCLAGPFHPALHHLVDSAIFFDMAKHLLQNDRRGSGVLFLCHPGDVSNLRGQRNENLLMLREAFGVDEISVHVAEDIPRGILVLQTQKGNNSIHRRELFDHAD
jgi:histone acetyltransferase (RNA polymerase elongator complex component)